eukprot:CAMPEP_0197552486 /NCGR_PEP_ID=MMETSP1320-20131121/5948_1 /TAXON_ID=91990 /ORGANISM="Bolidomonas sp., Strain RCC2347" /LENGTH=112 /DNA_ID=CAMNT_0043113067 /DNA_START=166 /DNA_END=502 /DNA_ORIENTATION=-
MMKSYIIMLTAAILSGLPPASAGPLWGCQCCVTCALATGTCHAVGGRESYCNWFGTACKGTASTPVSAPVREHDNYKKKQRSSGDLLWLLVPFGGNTNQTTWRRRRKKMKEA